MRNSFGSPNLVSPNTVGPKNKDSSSGCAVTSIGLLDRSREAGMSDGLVGIIYARSKYRVAGMNANDRMAKRRSRTRLRGMRNAILRIMKLTI